MRLKMLALVAGVGLVLVMDESSTAATISENEEVRQQLKEMWSWYQPNSEKLMSILATFDKVCRPLEAISIENLFSTCHISIQEARHLLHRIDDIESRLKALEGPQPTPAVPALSHIVTESSKKHYD